MTTAAADTDSDLDLLARKIEKTLAEDHTWTWVTPRGDSPWLFGPIVNGSTEAAILDPHDCRRCVGSVTLRGDGWDAYVGDDEMAEGEGTWAAGIAPVIDFLVSHTPARAVRDVVSWDEAVQVMADRDDDLMSQAIGCIVNGTPINCRTDGLEDWISGGDWDGSETPESVATGWEQGHVADVLGPALDSLNEKMAYELQHLDTSEVERLLDKASAALLALDDRWS